jgi:hypothetical protein
MFYVMENGKPEVVEQVVSKYPTPRMDVGERIIIKGVKYNISTVSHERLYIHGQLSRFVVNYDLRKVNSNMRKM